MRTMSVISTTSECKQNAVSAVWAPWTRSATRRDNYIEPFLSYSSSLFFYDRFGQRPGKLTIGKDTYISANNYQRSFKSFFNLSTYQLSMNDTQKNSWVTNDRYNLKNKFKLIVRKISIDWIDVEHILDIVRSIVTTFQNRWYVVKSVVICSLDTMFYRTRDTRWR